MRPRELSHAVSSLAVRTPTLLPATHTNSYALGTREVVLVEPATPYEDEQRVWLEWARSLASTGRTPVAIVITHHHPDHVGGAVALSRAMNLPVWAHEATLSRVEGLEARPDSLGVSANKRLADGDVIVLDGPTATRWEILHTPGHAPGHICLFERGERTLVVGDMVANVGTILIAPGDGHMATYLRQLARLEALPAALALPAHGEPIESPSTRFGHHIAHRRWREEKVLAAIPRDVVRSVEEVLAVAYDDTSRAIWPIALLSLRAHLEKLTEEGLVSEDERGWLRM